MKSLIRGQRLEWSERLSRGANWGYSVPDTENSKCTGPGEGVCLAYWRSVRGPLWLGGAERREQLPDDVSKVAGLAKDVVRTLDFTLGRGKPSEGWEQRRSLIWFPFSLKITLDNVENGVHRRKSRIGESWKDKLTDLSHTSLIRNFRGQKAVDWSKQSVKRKKNQPRII